MDRMERVLKQLEGRCSQAELVEVRTRRNSVSVSNNRIKGIKTVETAGYALRIMADGRLGFATATSVESPDAIISNALATAPFGEKVDFGFAPLGHTPTSEIYDEKVVKMTPDEQTAFISELCDRVKSAYPLGIVTGEAVTVTEQFRVVTSVGQDAAYVRTRFDCEVGSQYALEGDLRMSGDDYHGTGLPSAEKLDSIVKRTAQLMKLNETVASIKGGPTEVVFYPFSATELLWPLAVALNGDAVVRKISPLTGKLGETLFAPEFNLVDDGRMPQSPKSAPVDDEGTPTGRRTLIENGVLQGYLLDRRSARALGMEPTGNGLKMKALSAFKDVEGMPQGAPTNWLVAPGQRTTDEIIGSIDEGLALVFIGGSHSANHIGGQVAGNVYLGYKIEGGQLVGRVKNAMINLNVYEALRTNLAAISSDTELVSHFFVPSGFLMPAVHLSGVNIAVAK